MRKIKFIDDGQPSLFDENFGAASASVSGGRFAPTANKAAPCQFNKKLSAFEYIALSRTYGVSDDDLKEAKNKLVNLIKNFQLLNISLFHALMV